MYEEQEELCPLKRGMHPPIRAFFSPKSVDPPKVLFKTETITSSENRSVGFKELVHVAATVNFA